VIPIRLDRFVSKALGVTRTDAIKIIQSKQIRINDSSISKKDFNLNPKVDIVFYQGAQLNYYEKIYLMMNKPVGYVSATVDKKLPTVFDLLSGLKKEDLFIVGRLDIDSVGLLLITNDGDLAHKITSPKYNIEKEYEVLYYGNMTKEMINSFCNGIEIEDGRHQKITTKPAKLIISTDNGAQKAEVTISEGKFHQVKRMFEYFGCEVYHLKRVQIGQLKLDEHLKEGEYRVLSEEEINRLHI